MTQKITSLIIATILATGSLFATNMSGTYKVGTTEGAHYASLSAAVAAINAATIEGDIVLEITSDITEAANFGLAKDFGTYKLTIRPDADADRTITFTQATANAGPFGHFVIGCATENLGTALSDATVALTNNVTIDGYAVGGNTKRLILQTAEASLTSSAIINIMGESSNITVKNSIINNLSSGTGPMGIYVLQFKGTTKDVSPNNVLISNNTISAKNQTVSGWGVRCNRSGTATTRISGLQIQDNIITASGTCIEIWYCNGVNIRNNEIKVQKGTTTGSGIGVWLRGSTGDMNIADNKFSELVSVQTGTSTYATQGILTGATSVNPFNVNIFNNTFSGMNRSAAGPANLNQTYIADIGYGTTKIFQNTFYLPALTLPTQNGAYNAISFTTANYKADIKNNIFISDENAKSVLIAKAITTGVSDNNIFYLRAGNTNARVVDTHATLEAYKAANPTLDINSKSVNVTFEDAAAGDLRIAGLSIQDMNLEVPKLAEVPNDMFGTVRADLTYAGAHQSTLPFINPSTGTKNPGTNVMIQNTANGIQINLDKESSIEIYAVNGMLIDRTIAAGTFSRALDSGVYVLRINGNATKFIR
jgi:hypothetical protein